MWPIDDAWRERTLARMDSMGYNFLRLATEIGCKPAAISQLFDRGNRNPGKRPKTSRLVPAIHKVLGLPPPSTTSADISTAFIMENLPRLDEKDRETVRALIASLATKTRS